MKLEIGMYVRTINGKIWIITSQKAISGHRKDIKKASYNIIDLIQIGDYVNESKVVDISIIGKDKEKWVWVEQMEDTDNKYGDDYVGYNNEQIK